MYSYSSLALAALEQIQASGDILREGHQHPRSIRHKGRIDLVTETDCAVEEFLKERLEKLTPGIPFLAEESAENLELPEQCWIIDPVDGTTNFAHGLPIVATSVAFWEAGEVRLGIVTMPLLGEWYLAEKGQGAVCRDRPIAVSEVSDIRNALIATGFPYDIDACVDVILARMRPMLAQAQGVRRCGTAATDLAWVASGRFEAYYEGDLKPWDSAAGALLVTEAGGHITTMRGEPYRPGSTVLASNGHLHSWMLQTLKATV